MDPIAQPIELLDELDLTNVDTNRPLIKDGTIAKVRLESIETKQNKAGTGKNAIFKFALEEGAPTTDGKGVKPGFVPTPETVSLVPTENYNPAERLAQIQECLIGQKKKWNSGELIGQVGTVRYKIEESTEFGNKNRVGVYMKKKTTPVAALS